MYQDSQDTIIRPHVWTQRLEDLSHVGEYQYKRGEIPLRNGGKGVEGPTPSHLKSIIPQDVQERHFWTMVIVVTLVATAGFVYLSMNVPHCVDALNQYEKFFKFLKESKSYPWSWTNEEWMKILRSEQGGGMKGPGSNWTDFVKKFCGKLFSFGSDGGSTPPLIPPKRGTLLIFYKK